MKKVLCKVLMFVIPNSAEEIVVFTVQLLGYLLTEFALSYFRVEVSFVALLIFRVGAGVSLAAVQIALEAFKHKMTEQVKMKQEEVNRAQARVKLLEGYLLKNNHALPY